MKKEQDSSRHHRSTSRISINRIRQKHPKPVKSPSGPADPQNKQNQHDNRTHNRSHFNSNTPHKEDTLADISRKFNSQMAEKDMAVMELKNALKKAELEGRRRDQEAGDLERELQAKERVLGALGVQNAGLNSALEVLKTQTAQVTASNQNLISQSANLKKQLAQKTLDIKKIEQQLAKSNKDLQIYNSLEPRLKQLEQLQDRLIEQNQRAKEQRQLFITTLKNIQRILKNIPQKSAECRQIQTLIFGFID